MENNGHHGSLFDQDDGLDDPNLPPSLKGDILMLRELHERDEFKTPAGF